MKELDIGVSSEPSSVVGFDVVPSWFQLVVSCPYELGLDVLVVGVEHAFTNLVDIRVAEICGVNWAFAFMDASPLGAAAERSHDRGGSVEINSELSWEVTLWAVNPVVTRALWSRSSIVEATEPMGAIISGQGPFSNPDWVLNVLGVGLDERMVSVTTGLQGLWLVPGLVVMDIHDNVFHVVISEEVVPVCVVSVDGDDLSVVEYKFSLRSVFLNQFS